MKQEGKTEKKSSILFLLIYMVTQKQGVWGGSRATGLFRKEHDSFYIKPDLRSRRSENPNLESTEKRPGNGWMYPLMLPQQNLPSLTSFNPALAWKHTKVHSLCAYNCKDNRAWILRSDLGLCFLFCFPSPKLLSSPEMICTEVSSLSGLTPS